MTAPCCREIHLASIAEIFKISSSMMRPAKIQKPEKIFSNPRSGSLKVWKDLFYLWKELLQARRNSFPLWNERILLWKDPFYLWKERLPAWETQPRH
jgi:hypothetical protein